MSDAEQGSSQQSNRTVRIPSILTNSFRTIVDAFGEDIIRIKAQGSVETTNRTVPGGFQQYGLTREQRSTHRITLDYEQLPGDQGPANPLDAEAQKELFDQIEAVLDTEKITVDPDIAVTSFAIRVESPQLKEVTPAQSTEFDLQFVSDPAETPIEEPTKRVNAGRGLYDELGFNLRNLNLRSVVETATKYHEQSDGRYLSWGGPDDIRPRVPEKLAVRINKQILPDHVGALKPYYVTDDRVLQVPEDADEDVEDQTSTGLEVQ